MNHVKELSRVKCHDGTLLRVSHYSTCCDCTMIFALFLPSTKKEEKKIPLITYLSGLTCTDENVCQKGHAFSALAREQIAFLVTDTSPRGHPKIEGEDESWEFGLSAGFYIDATTESFKKNYNMNTYVVKEIEEVLRSRDEISEAIDFDRQSIMGHSMGGHGALTLGLKNLGKFRSISAFSPISNPSSEDCSIGQKCFKGYLGEDKAKWKSYDATEIVRMTDFTKEEVDKIHIIIDQGSEDSFLRTQLYPERFVEAAAKRNLDCSYALHEGYDHGYYFVQTFMDKHIRFHAKYLKE